MLVNISKNGKKQYEKCRKLNNLEAV